jgi:hypothetical protein
MAEPTVKDMVRTVLEAHIVTALKETPEALDTLVKAALSREVDSRNGSFEGYGTKVPYLDYIAGETIRTATSQAVRKVVQEMQPEIEAEVRKILTSEQVVQAFTKCIIGSTDQDYKISVSFEKADR